MSDEENLGADAPERIPDHELVRRIGRGSYGEVWLARTMMGTYRAVKIVHRKAFQHDRPFERELAGIQKFEPISRSHEGFIDVLQVGQNREAGYFYYVMEIGDDEQTRQTINPDNYSPKTLAKELTDRGMSPFEECLQIGLSLTNALAHLHRRGLIHRDVKPSNIILVNGIAKLADIGLVADISEARSYVGTEGFIPPEGPGTPAQLQCCALERKRPMLPRVLRAHGSQVDRPADGGRHSDGRLTRQRAIGSEAGQAATPDPPVRLTFPQRIVIIGAVEASTPDALHAGVLHQRRGMV